MNASTLKRLNHAFSKLNLKIDLDDNLYKIYRLTDNNSCIAEVLLPSGFPLEKKAVQQLISFADAANVSGGCRRAAFATPDFHAGSLVPVGTVVATTNNMIIPQAISTDIHCGMRLHICDIKYEEFIKVFKGDIPRI